MKILQVNCVYNTGSTGKIMYDIHTVLLEKGYESVVCYGRGNKTNDEYVYKTCGELYSKFNNLLSRFTGIMYGGCLFSTNKLISVIKKEKPDIVHLQCLNGYFVNIYRLINWLKVNRIKTVLTLHAEFMHTANCGYAFECEKWKTGCGKCPHLKKETKSLLFDGTARSFRKMKKAFDGFDKDLVVVSVSNWIKSRAEQSPILNGKKHTVIVNGLNIDNFYPRDVEELKKSLELQIGKTILFVTPAFSLNPKHIKGGYYVVELAKMLPDMKFVVVGNTNKDVQLPENVIDIGRVENQPKLAEYYSVADVMVITSKSDNYPTVCLEANCCGTPVVGFDVGGISETIFAGMGQTVPHGNLQALMEAVKEYAVAKSSLPKETVDMCRERNSRSRMAKDYIDLYKDLLEDQN